ncbi:MAG TPA: hypothetical protein VFU23_11765 [Gemmatimonadales bacterium]|nr:hypothetical protein [Gemmatimonadales bacterium]
MASPPTPPPWPAFRVFALCFIPETRGAGEPQWRELETVVAHALAARPPRVRRQIALFVRVIDWAARARYRRRFAALDPARGTALLERFAASRLLLFRRGVWGLRTLVMMGWYTNASVIAGLGYRAAAAGWEARR